MSDLVGLLQRWMDDGELWKLVGLGIAIGLALSFGISVAAMLVEIALG
jgi:hypothetical protein